MGEPTVMTPEEVARRWACGATTIRAMLRSRQLTGFKLGKDWRIPRHVVERVEACGSYSTEDPGAPIGETTTEPAGFRSGPQIVRLPSSA